MIVKLLIYCPFKQHKKMLTSSFSFLYFRFFVGNMKMNCNVAFLQSYFWNRKGKMVSLSVWFDYYYKTGAELVVVVDTQARFDASVVVVIVVDVVGFVGYCMIIFLQGNSTTLCILVYQRRVQSLWRSRIPFAWYNIHQC